MDAANAGALSGLTSAVAVGGLGAAAGVAAGELAFGPEMLPLAAATLLAGALSSWLGVNKTVPRRIRPFRSGQVCFTLAALNWIINYFKSVLVGK